MATLMGFFCAIIGLIAGIYIIVQKVLFPDILLGYTSLMSALLFIGGMLMLILGLIGEYIGRIYICINQSPQYVVRDSIN
jgi:undecaprenyl-phosphate 4-deoxy-4-formamido-L-arabinose transferase